MDKFVDLTRFKGHDDLDTFTHAMAFSRENPGTTLHVPPGIYILTTPMARETQRKVMAGEYGSNPQPTMFHRDFKYSRGICFAGQRNTKMLAYGATFLVDGFMEPVSIHDCQGVTVAGLTIDHVRKPFSMGTITGMEEDGTGGKMIVSFGDDFRIEPKTPLLIRCCAYNAGTRRFDPLRPGSAEVIDDKTAVFRLPSHRPELLGFEFYTWHTAHSRPAILIENAVDVTLMDITIHSQPGMGIVGNRSENIDIRNLNVVPSVGTHMSTNTDATHFTSIKGKLRMDGCVFDGQGDDSLNVHAYFHTIHPVSSQVCRMRMDFKDGTHAQTLDYPDEGDILELTRQDTLEVVERYRVLKCVPTPAEWFAEVTLDKDLPGNTEGYFLADITRLPFLEFTNNKARNHWARGILVKTRGALIANNTFEDLLGMGIEIAAESWWMEGVCPADITIRRNRIINCAETKKAAICVMPDCGNPVGTPIRNIIIEDNIIDCPDAPHGILLSGVDGVMLSRNHIRCKGERIVIRNCTNVQDCISQPPITNNKYKG